MILTPNTPQNNYQGQKFSLSLSLSLSPSHLKEHNCLSLIQLKSKKILEKARGIKLFLNGTEGKIVHSSHDHGLVL